MESHTDSELEKKPRYFRGSLVLEDSGFRLSLERNEPPI
jgi:hypothetical protein